MRLTTPRVRRKRSVVMTNLFSTPQRAVVALTLLILGLAQSYAEDSSLRAGVARVNLTPPLEMKAALGGYGARMSKPAVGVHDAIWAKALVLAQDDRKFALVTADVLAFPPGFKAAVMERLATNGWNANQVLLLASHSHTSIDMMALHPGNVFGIPQVGLFHKALFERTAEQLAEVIREASKDLATISTASATSSVPDRNRNRRHAGDIHDTDLTVTRIDTAAGKPLAVLVNWTAHPTFMDAEDMWFSGGWPGHLQRSMEALIGEGVTVMFYNGAEGDQSPVPPEDCPSHWERAERYGREMGIIAWRAWEKIRPVPGGVLEYHTQTIVLPKRQPHPDFMKTGGAEYGLNEARMGEFLERLVPPQTHSTCLRLGDLLILGVPGEMAAQLGLEAKSRVRQTTGVHCVAIGGLADEWISYMLPAAEYRKGGYEASMSFYGETLASTVLDGVVQGTRVIK
ncbi:MAG TPA: neutral/alkaline non-lysosomal ceramidase N-terminal domain-containing protein [Verrucomicrobiae bacterium]|nr:neutral/alkaline non-lysosomal ceramidase N-terminal domain-containing protein [Verrucomicrobiae bacterium]